MLGPIGTLDLLPGPRDFCLQASSGNTAIAHGLWRITTLERRRLVAFNWFATGSAPERRFIAFPKAQDKAS